MSAKPELWIKSNCINAEGPVWDEATGTFYFVDVEAGKIFSYKDDVLTTWEAGERVGCAVPCEDGRILAGLETGIYLVDFPNGGKLQLCDPEPDLEMNRFNDGKADPQGRFLAGTLTMGASENDPAKAALYRLKRNEDDTFEAVPVIKNAKLANGLAWTADEKIMYFSDTFYHTVTPYIYTEEDEEFVPAPGKKPIRIPDDWGFPDGMTIDDEGMVWIALWGGGAVTRWNPETGELLEKIELPAFNVSSCCFGGPDMDELFITTASQDTDMTKYPLAGNVFRMKAGVTGAKSYKAKL